ncbi:MAG: MaoC family dehydratase N-terminal domain-containing protein [Rhodobacteraceae bacterium]|nr:MaoC family dehydratase N-terminal domain-containing protein [Paracoccaceae bacterium]
MSGRRLNSGHHAFNDLLEGDRIETGSVQITGEMINQFAELSGDYFEIHMDVETAHRLGFTGRVAHGLLVLSVIDGLKNNAPAQISAIASLSWDWNFKEPVLEGDSVRAEITILSKRTTRHAGKGILKMQFNVFNQNDVLVQTGHNHLMVRC